MNQDGPLVHKEVFPLNRHPHERREDVKGNAVTASNSKFFGEWHASANPREKLIAEKYIRPLRNIPTELLTKGGYLTVCWSLAWCDWKIESGLRTRTGIRTLSHLSSTSHKRMNIHVLEWPQVTLRQKIRCRPRVQMSVTYYTNSCRSWSIQSKIGGSSFEDKSKFTYTLYASCEQ